MPDLPFQIPPDWLSFLALAGTPIFGAWFISEFVEKEPWFQRLLPEWKSRAVIVLLLALAVVSRVLLLNASGEPVTVQEIYVAVVQAFVGYLMSSWYHGKLHNPTKVTSEQREQAAREAKWVEAPKLSGAPEPVA